MANDLDPLGAISKHRRRSGGFFSVMEVLRAASDDFRGWLSPLAPLLAPAPSTCCGGILNLRSILRQSGRVLTTVSMSVMTCLYISVFDR